MKNRHKLTPDVDKQIIVLAKTLGKFQRKDKSGQPMSRVTSRVVLGSELEPGTLINGVKVDPYKKYVQRGAEAILVNHELNLRECYKKDGQSGIDAYAKFFIDLLEEQKEKLKAEQLAQANIVKEEIDK